MLLTWLLFVAIFLIAFFFIVVIILRLDVVIIFTGLRDGFSHLATSSILSIAFVGQCLGPSQGVIFTDIRSSAAIFLLRGLQTVIDVSFCLIYHGLNLL